MSPLALAHNDDAVLERHHAHTTFTVLYTPGADLCANMGRDDRITCRKTVKGR